MSYRFFQNTQCEYYPCHRYPHKDFNCLFCYCPLHCYEDCGGNYEYIGDGIKDCSQCLIPHKPENYDYIVSKIIELGRRYGK